MRFASCVFAVALACGVLVAPAGIAAEASSPVLRVSIA